MIIILPSTPKKNDEDPTCAIDKLAQIGKTRYEGRIPLFAMLKT